MHVVIRRNHQLLMLAARLLRRIELAQAVQRVADDVPCLFFDRDCVCRVRYVIRGQPLRAQLLEPLPRLLQYRLDVTQISVERRRLCPVVIAAGYGQQQGER